MILRAVAILVILWATAFAIFATTLPRPADEGATDGIVVLTGSAGRIERGLALLRAQKAKRLFISGVDPDTGPAAISRTYHIARETMRCCVELGHEAIDTRSNAIETSVWIRRRHYRSVRLITTDWHMARAAFELRRQLPGDVTLVPDAVATQPSLRILLREFHKYLFRRAAGLAGI